MANILKKLVIWVLSICSVICFAACNNGGDDKRIKQVDIACESLEINETKTVTDINKTFKIVKVLDNHNSEVPLDICKIEVVYLDDNKPIDADNNQLGPYEYSKKLVFEMSFNGEYDDYKGELVVPVKGKIPELDEIPSLSTEKEKMLHGKAKFTKYAVNLEFITDTYAGGAVEEWKPVTTEQFSVGVNKTIKVRRAKTGIEGAGGLAASDSVDIEVKEENIGVLYSDSPFIEVGAADISMEKGGSAKYGYTYTAILPKSVSSDEFDHIEYNWTIIPDPKKGGITFNEDKSMMKLVTTDWPKDAYTVSLVVNAVKLNGAEVRFSKAETLNLK